MKTLLLAAAFVVSAVSASQAHTNPQTNVSGVTAAPTARTAASHDQTYTKLASELVCDRNNAQLCRNHR